MGSQYSCSNCCIEKDFQVNHKLKPNFTQQDDKAISPDLMEMCITLPDPIYAKPVRSIIDMTNTVRQTYKEQRVALTTRRNSLRGTLMQAYYIFDKNAYYEGQWKNGLPHGHGRLHFDNGSLYEGTINQGEIDSQNGLFIFSNGDYYKGCVKSNKANGNGCLRFGEMYYIGQWLNNLPHGEGSETYQGCYKYKGQFKFGKKHGQGVFVWPNIGSYEGSFVENQLQGRGVLLRMEEGIFEGEFFANKKHGRGKMSFRNGDIYDGEFSNDLREGQGTFTWAQGIKYIGGFKQDLQHGYGRLTYSDGNTIDGSWMNGILDQKSIHS